MASKDDDKQPTSSGGPQYRLLADHVIDGRIVRGGTLVGAGTDVPFDLQPSNQMEGVNEEGKRRVNEFHKKVYGTETAPWHTPEAEKAREDARQADEEERKREEESGLRASAGAKPVTGGQSAPTSAPSISGSTGPNLGVPPPKQDVNDPDVQVRSAKPLEDSKP